MTTLIYRGIAHAPTSTPAPRKPKPMLYRGAAHDGIAPRALRTAALMAYRGIDYVIDANGERRVLDSVDGAGIPV
jgi:hypothetical protein